MRNIKCDYMLYNSNDRGIKRLNKKQLQEIETAEDLQERKENSFEPSRFKRVSLGGKDGYSAPF